MDHGKGALNISPVLCLPMELNRVNTTKKSKKLNKIDTVKMVEINCNT